MAFRLPTAQLYELRVLPATRTASRSFSSPSAVLAPPLRQKGRVSPYAKGKGVATADDGAGQPTTSLLQEMTLPPPDLTYLEEFLPETLTPESIGQVRAFSSGTMAAFNALTIPSTLQKEFAFTPRPATVIRGSTLKVAGLLDEGRKSSSRDSRTALVGGAGSGKSITMLQAISYAKSTGWVVLYLPSATPLIDSSTPHTYSSTTGTFHQPLFSRQLLIKLAAANKDLFRTLKTSKELTIGERVLNSGTSLEELATKGVDERNATEVLEVLFEELANQKTHPVLLAIDDAQPLFTTSSYVDPSYKILESFHLSIPRLLLSYISGTKSFNLGTVLLSSSTLSKRQSEAMTAFLHSHNPANVFAKAPKEGDQDAREVYRKALEGIGKVFVEERLDRKEALGVVRMLEGWRGVREVVSDQSFLEKYVAADGNPRYFMRALERNQTLKVKLVGR